MSSPLFPGADVRYGAMSDDATARHEAIVDLFGRYLMWLRRRNHESTRTLTEDSVARSKLGAIQRRPFDGASELADDEREVAILLAEASADRFIRSFFHFLNHQGTDFPLGEGHHLRFRLEVEVSRNRDGEIVERDVINRGGARCLHDYWGRWINRAGDEIAPASE
ncbi:hypothetical protein [Planctomyces sp. SH-PL62]|uniref:hypothetical protein n=1 Tax=Planctomyces sp. SH-PL62 TaxID=1636152 RepID=UPI00078CD4D8|nr:hypothetical protein [Planctomyces sp. SH-PL62]AMV38609.1 hypothetical protein VT85_14320 [Planctomyces sp. SH-PL62]